MSEPVRIGLIGERLEHSKSPQLFDAIFSLAGMTGIFLLHPTAPYDLTTALCRCRELSPDGVAVTIPHKQTVVALLDRIEGPADRMGAVNGIAFEPEGSVGFNTDASGFVAPLKKHLARLGGGKGLVIGAGGAAAAVLYSLLTENGMAHVVVAGRSQRRLGELHERFGSERIQTVALDQLGSIDCSDCGLIVNCTPLAGPLHPYELPLPEKFVWPPGVIYYDLNYNDNNLAMQLAREVGVVTIDGSAMLAAQGVRLFERWTGRGVPWEEVHQRVFPDRAEKAGGR